MYFRQRKHHSGSEMGLSLENKRSPPWFTESSRDDGRTLMLAEVPPPRDFQAL